MNAYLHGIRVVLNENMTDTVMETRDRSLAERLFTFPWNPFRNTKQIAVKVPSSEIYNMEDRLLIMHPELFKKLEAKLDEQ